MVGLVPEQFEEAYINQHVALARPVPTVHAPYLAWCLSSPPSQEQFRKLQRGATKVGLGLEDICSIEVRLPSLDEQRRIVAEIEKQFTRLEAGVAALRRVQANLKRYRAAVLKAACEGKLVPTEAELHRQLKTKSSKLETGAELLARILAERRKTGLAAANTKNPPPPTPPTSHPCPKAGRGRVLNSLGKRQPALLHQKATPLSSVATFHSSNQPTSTRVTTFVTSATPLLRPVRSMAEFYLNAPFW